MEDDGEEAPDESDDVEDDGETDSVGAREVNVDDVELFRDDCTEAGDLYGMSMPLMKAKDGYGASLFLVVARGRVDVEGLFCE